MLHLASVFQHDQGATHVGGFLCSSNECAYVSGVIKFSGNHVKALKCLFQLFVSAVVGWLFWLWKHQLFYGIPVLSCVDLNMKD